MVSRTQRCVLISSAEAEYMTLAECSKEAKFVYHLQKLLEPGRYVPPVILREGNEWAISLSAAPTKLL